MRLISLTVVIRITDNWSPSEHFSLTRTSGPDLSGTGKSAQRCWRHANTTDSQEETDMNTTRHVRAEDLMEGDELANGRIVSLVEWSIDGRGVESVNVVTHDVHAEVFAAKDIIEITTR